MNRRVVASVVDMFFASKIRGTAEQHGVEVSFGRTLERVLEAARRAPTHLVIVDLEADAVDPVLLAESLKSDEQLRHIPVVGYFSHVNTDVRQRALDAGFDQVMPRSAFNARLLQLLAGES